MEPAQFQALVVAWGAALTTLIAVLLGLALAIKAALERIFAAHVETTVAVAKMDARVTSAEQTVNGALTPRIEQIADARISQHRRTSDA